jgi:uncharacterized membrane protein YczE
MRDRWLDPDVLRRMPALMAGLVLFGIAVAFMVRSGLGQSPWETFHQGISLRTGLPMGTISILLGVPILLLWLPLGQRPGIGTLINVLTIGTLTNLTLDILPPAAEPLGGVVWFGVGLGLLAVGSGMYLAAALGPGPRDGLFTAIHHRTGWRIAYVRASLEIAVLAIGYLLGGTIGLGTLVFALTIGHLTELSLRYFDREGRVLRRPAPARPPAAVEIAR